VEFYLKFPPCSYLWQWKGGKNRAIDCSWIFISDKKKSSTKIFPQKMRKKIYLEKKRHQEEEHKNKKQ